MLHWVSWRVLWGSACDERSDGAGADAFRQSGRAVSAVKPRVIVDCDPGHDDVLALAVAAAHCDVVGITVVAGNSGLSNTVRNALLATDLFGLEHVPVHAGADRPLVAPQRTASQAHGESGLDGPTLFTPTRKATGTDAVGFLIDAVRAEEGLWLVPTGPLTNIALALRAAPDLAGRVAGISLMGGSATHGNISATAEFNTWADPEAAAIVFDCGAPIRMCGLNVTHQADADSAFIDTLRTLNTFAGGFAADMVVFYRSFQASLRGARDDDATCPLHDPCAVLALTHPKLFEFRRRHVEVELTGTLTRGMTVVDERPWRATGGRVEVAYRADRAAVLDLVVDAVRTRGRVAPPA
jgi:inosine-uridine nucleoside N-ribohydrolase